MRRWLHARGYRFRVDYAKLRGRPDVALPKHRLAIFVHGCYWHGNGCGNGSMLKTNPEFGQDKFARNAERYASEAHLRRWLRSGAPSDIQFDLKCRICLL